MLRCLANASHFSQAFLFLPYTGDDFSEYHRIIKKGDDSMVFEKGSVPVRIAAKVYGKNPEWVRRGIVSGYLPIGVATRDGKQITDVTELNCRYGRTNFYISPKKLYEETGYIWEGEK